MPDHIQCKQPTRKTALESPPTDNWLCKDFRNGAGSSYEQRHNAILDEQRKVISTLITTHAPVFKHQRETESTQKLPSLPQSYITETGKTRRLLFQTPNGVIENRLKGPAGGPQSKVAAVA